MMASGASKPAETAQEISFLTVKSRRRVEGVCHRGASARAGLGCRNSAPFRLGGACPARLPPSAGPAPAGFALAGIRAKRDGLRRELYLAESARYTPSSTPPHDHDGPGAMRRRGTPWWGHGRPPPGGPKLGYRSAGGPRGGRRSLGNGPPCGAPESRPPQIGGVWVGGEGCCRRRSCRFQGGPPERKKAEVWLEGRRGGGTQQRLEDQNLCGRRRPDEGICARWVSRQDLKRQKGVSACWGTSCSGLGVTIRGRSLLGKAGGD